MMDSSKEASAIRNLAHAKASKKSLKKVAKRLGSH
jgi:hypothetical protein